MASDVVVSAKAVITEVGGMPEGGFIESEKPLITGISDPFATVDVYDGTALLGVASANGHGGWSLQLTTPLFDGIHDLSAIQVGDYGASTTTGYFAITVQAPEMAEAPNDANVSPVGASWLNRGAAEAATPYFPHNPFTARSARGAIAEQTDTASGAMRIHP
ncbi:hemolysin-type calcium-binding region [Caballeronia udeis]|uniref:Hemolysin-type calcium-binding region n=1 Tax=Caballeronia udeis TaxID=1232866 RepID=A0A158I4C1_9BURK|nr:Ig-like domain-containing protein [Caballeronia udeis]SAL51203.1 hemolysin-type calcium-binding region [Caballeronia udeis]